MLRGSMGFCNNWVRSPQKEGTDLAYTRWKHKKIVSGCAAHAADCHTSVLESAHKLLIRLVPAMQASLTPGGQCCLSGIVDECGMCDGDHNCLTTGVINVTASVARRALLQDATGLITLIQQDLCRALGRIFAGCSGVLVQEVRNQSESVQVSLCRQVGDWSKLQCSIPAEHIQGSGMAHGIERLAYCQRPCVTLCVSLPLQLTSFAELSIYFASTACNLPFKFACIRDTASFAERSHFHRCSHDVHKRGILSCWHRTCSQTAHLR
jgi:hypothetical protein